MPELPSFLTANEVAAMLRCQPEKVYRLAAHGQLPSYKVQGSRLFNLDEILAWLRACRDGVRSDTSADAGKED